jgi:lipopolysaccharide export system protein LptA
MTRYLAIQVITILVFSISCFSQDKQITVIGDSLVGKTINGMPFREVYGNVILTQGNVTIKCNKAIQDIAANNAELIGNVVATQDNITITTPRGFYYGNQRKSWSNSGIKLDDKKVILTADKGEYYFDEDRAFFQQHVKLYDTVTTMTSVEMTYYQKENRMVAVNNVKIIDKENDIDADTVDYLKYERVAIADGHVKLFNRVNNLTIYGDHIEDYAKNVYTLANKNPLLIQYDTVLVERSDTLNNEIIKRKVPSIDTLVIRSKKMQAYRGEINTFIATDSVELVRNDFSSRNNRTIYYKNDDKIITYKIAPTEPQPILWQANSQLTGDSTTIYLEKNRIRKLDVKGAAFILSMNKIYNERKDQIAGDLLSILFDSSKIKRTDVSGSVYSLYYMYDKNEPNGITKSSSQKAAILFNNNQVSQVRLYGTPNSEYYPENLVTGKEPSFTLPQYVFYDSRPVKENILSSYFKNRSEAK